MILSNVTIELHKLPLRQKYMSAIEILTNNSYERDRAHIL
jgi:phosphoribosylformylglycinamidine (FGAM) synthase-like enzyme